MIKQEINIDKIMRQMNKQYKKHFENRMKLVSQLPNYQTYPTYQAMISKEEINNAK